MKPILPKSSVMGASLPQIRSILASPGTTIILTPPMAPTFAMGAQGAPQPTSIILPTPATHSITFSTQSTPQPTPLIFPLSSTKVTTSMSRYPPLLAPKNTLLKLELENQHAPTNSSKGKKDHLRKSKVREEKIQKKMHQPPSLNMDTKKSGCPEITVKSVLPKFPQGAAQTLIFVPAPLPAQKPSVVSPLIVASKSSLVIDNVRIPLDHPKRVVRKNNCRNVIAKENDKKLHQGLSQEIEESYGMRTTSCKVKSDSLGQAIIKLKKNKKVSKLLPVCVPENSHTDTGDKTVLDIRDTHSDKSVPVPSENLSTMTSQMQSPVPSKDLSLHLPNQLSPEQDVPHHPPPPYPQPSSRKDTDSTSHPTQIPSRQEVERTVKEIQYPKTACQKSFPVTKKLCERRCRRQLSFAECPTSISTEISVTDNFLTNTSCSNDYANEFPISVPSVSTELAASASSSVNHSYSPYNSSTIMVPKSDGSHKNSHTVSSSLIPPTYSTSSSMAENASSATSKSYSDSKDPPLYIAPSGHPTLEETVFSPTSSVKSHSYLPSVYSPVPPIHPVAGTSSTLLQSSSTSSMDFMHSSIAVCQSQFSSSYSSVLAVGHTPPPLGSSALASPQLDNCVIASSSQLSHQVSYSHQPKPIHYNVSGETTLFTQNSQPISSCHPPQPTPSISPPYPTFYDRSPRPSLCNQSPHSSLHAHSSCPSSYVHSSHSASCTHSHQSSSYTQSPQPTSYIQSPQPTSYTQSPQPASYTQSPQPASYTQSPQPISYTQSPHPSSYTQSPRPASYTQSLHPSSYIQSPQSSSYTQSHPPTSYTQTSPQLNTYALSTQPSTYTQSSPRTCYTQSSSYTQPCQPNSYIQSRESTSHSQSPQPASYTHSHHPVSYVPSPQPALYTQSPQSRHPNSYIQSEHLSGYGQSSQTRAYPVQTPQCVKDNGPGSPQALSFSSGHVPPYCQSPQPESYSQPPHTIPIPAKSLPINTLAKGNSRSPHLPAYTDPSVSPSSSHYFPSQVNLSYTNVYGSQQTNDANYLQSYVSDKGMPLSSPYSAAEVNSSFLSVERSLSPPSYEAHLQNTASYLTSDPHSSNFHYDMAVTHQQTVPENYSLSCHSTRVEQDVSAVPSDPKKSVKSPPAYPSPPVLLPPPRYTSNLQAAAVTHHSDHVVSDVNKGSYEYSSEESSHTFFPNTPPMPPPPAAPPSVDIRSGISFPSSQDYSTSQSHSLSQNSASASAFSGGAYLPFQDTQHTSDDIEQFQESHNRTCKSTNQETSYKHHAQETNLVSDWRNPTRGVGISCNESLKVHSLIERAERLWFIPHQEQNRVYMKRKELAKGFLNHPDVHSTRDMMLKEKFWIEEDEPIAEEILLSSLTTSTLKEHNEQQEEETVGDCSPAVIGDLDNEIVMDGTNSRRKKIREMLCQVCGKMLKGRSSLKSHLNSHHKIQPHACPYCSKSFTNRSVLVVHLRIHTGEMPYACSICDTSFRTRSGLTRHKSLHTNVRPHECSMCSKTFKTKLVLQQHLKLHLTGLFTCSDCGKTFERHKSLAVHKASHHHKLRRFPCPHCHKGYQFRSLLNHHLQVHSKIRKHVCSVCNESFVWRSGLAAHMKTHSNSRPKCDICGMRFASEKRLDTHYRRHSNPQPHRCEVCGRSFSHAYRLASHILIHQEHKEYACSECGVVLTSAKKLKKHLINHRKEEPRICRLSGTIEIPKSTM